MCFSGQGGRGERELAVIIRDTVANSDTLSYEVENETSPLLSEMFFCPIQNSAGNNRITRNYEEEFHGVVH